MEIKKPLLWYENYKIPDGIKYIINQGGSSSGKTWNIMDVLLYRMCTEKNLVITVTGPNFPALQRGAARDCSAIWNASEFYKKVITQPNQNGCKCEITGSVMEFATFYNVEVSKGSKRDILFINEATAVPYEIAWELMARTKKHVYIDFNPSNRYWAHEKFEGAKNAKWIFSTHKANHFIPESIHEELEALKDKDPERYKVYALGETGKTDGLIYQNWTQVEALPDDFKWRVFGLDFGFVNSFTSLIECRYVNGELYVKEHIYKTGMTNQDIAEQIKKLGFQNEIIICDSAELKSIEELKRNNIINAKPAIKGPGSVAQGISLLQSMKMNITQESIHTKVDLMNYRWQNDDLGHLSNTPDKSHYDPHTLDALRYAVSFKFAKPTNKSHIGGF